ncbi:hypothetical protein LDO31_01660 [Luteimonas sp. XNQY3]|nr:hypothetical protein [Luteimonas sp. XNQY3]MCD9004959.1 hypothetical protein [Luteimonas sp. XNQY3]
MTSHHLLRWWRIGALLAALVICLWIGWRDFDLWITQDAIREAIRVTIRRSAQVAVQFVAPAALAALLTRELRGWLRPTRRHT